MWGPLEANRVAGPYQDDAKLRKMTGVFTLRWALTDGLSPAPPAAPPSKPSTPTPTRRRSSAPGPSAVGMKRREVFRLDIAWNRASRCTLRADRPWVAIAHAVDLKEQSGHENMGLEGVAQVPHSRPRRHRSLGEEEDPGPLVPQPGRQLIGEAVDGNTFTGELGRERGEPFVAGGL